MFSDNPNPYWEPPENEKPRMVRVKEGIKKHVKDIKKLLFVVVKSWNDNVVCYEYGGPKFVSVSWLSIEPADKERHIRMGNESLRSTLTPAEELLFGCDVDIVEGDRYLVKINQEQLASRVFEIVMDKQGNPAIIGTINGVLCKLEHAYVQMKKGSIPQAEYMNLCGKSVSDGKSIVETIASSS
jgi:hypothetical protein